jgi:hypothetical protein
VDDWTIAAGISDGPIFRRVNRFDKVWGEAITPQGDLAHSQSRGRTGRN